MDAELVANAVPLAPDAVLRALADAVWSDGGDVFERPVVRLRIASGHVLEGRLIGLGSDRHEEVVLLGCPANGLPDEAVYIRVRDIAAAGVLHAQRYRDVLSGGALAVLPEGVPVTRLELRRRYAPTGDLPLRLDWDAMPDSAAATANLAGLLAALRQAVEAVQVDEPGRRAWAGVSAVRVEHRPGQRLTVARTPDGLLVAADLEAALPRRLADELDRALNAAL